MVNNKGISKNIKSNKLDYKIENVVATVSSTIKEKLDLVKLARKIVKSKYNPEKFPGLILKLEDPKSTFLIFTTGKMVATGNRKIEDIPLAVEKVIKLINSVEKKIKSYDIKVENIVASYDLDSLIDLNLAAIVMNNIMYEPEVFPGLIFRIYEPYAVFLVFSTGKVVCTGTTNKKELKKALLKLIDSINKADVYFKHENVEMEDITFV